MHNITSNDSNHLYSKDLGSSVDRPDQSHSRGTDGNYMIASLELSCFMDNLSMASSHPFDFNPSQPPINDPSALSIDLTLRCDGGKSPLII